MTDRHRLAGEDAGFRGVITAGKLVIDAIKKAVYYGNRKISLTAHEYWILEYLALNSGKAVSTREILRNVLNYSTVPSTTIVETRICGLRRKLADYGATDMIGTRRRLGYVFERTTTVSPCVA